MGLKAILLRRYIVLIALLFCVQGRILAQLSARFSAAIQSGCAPIVVQFQDESTGQPSQWYWDMGNGSVSYLQHPSATYFTPGTYHIKLVVRNGNSADSIVRNGYITVYPNPQVDFLASDTAGCFPLPVQFTDLSITASGTIAHRSWDFGDGATSSEQHPVHSYTSAGAYAVTLRLTNSYGCVSTKSKTRHVQIGSGVKAAFTNNNPGLCQAPVTIQFSNQSTSTAAGSLSYRWDFGDGSSSVEPSPAYTYSRPGSFTVKLIITSSLGCVDSVVKEHLVTVGSVEAGFEVPQSLCEGAPISFTNTSVPAPGEVLWHFGDGTTSAQPSPVKEYHAAGEYTVKLVGDFGGCKDSVSKKIVVKTRPQPSFTVRQAQGCQVPFSVGFTNTTPGTNTYKWLFGDGSTSTDVSPQHTYTALGNYSVTLIVFNEQGCSDTLVQKDYVKVLQPVVQVSGLMQTGCVPLVVTPTATVESAEPVVAYLWRFGDGTTSTEVSPSHSYTSAGNYNVTLVVTTASGCQDSVVIIDAVRTGEKSQSGFSVDPPVVCAKDPVSFTDSSKGNITEWLWMFGDGVISKMQHPIHVYQDTGLFSVSLITNPSTCPDTIIVSNAVYVKPPIAIFAVVNNCDKKFDKIFTDRSSGALTWYWDFGDGSTSSDQMPFHTYASPGTYSVTLQVTNGSCDNSSTQTVRVIDEKAAFNIDPDIVCKGGTVNFKARDINTTNIAGVEWDFGNSVKAKGDFQVAHTYSKTGKFIPSMTITDLLGCASTKTEEVTVYGPTANFFPSVAGACLNNSLVSFADSSKTDGVNNIIKRVWSFGDGTIDSTTPMPYQHIYSRAGVYTVTLKVADSYGCTDVISKQNAVVIAQPKADFISADSVSCTDKPIRFVNRSAGYNLKYDWNFGDGTVNNDVNPTYHYNATGLYTISLAVTDQYGCKDSVKKSEYINISYPSAAFEVSDSFATCPPLLVNFTNLSSHYTSLNWSFDDDGNNSIHQNPSHYYTLPGVFKAKLKVTGPGGCVDSLVKKIELKGPSGRFESPKQTGCVPHTVNFKAQTKNSSTFIWDYSDGNTFSGKDSVVTHTYTHVGSYVPKMILVDENGCKVSFQGKDTIKIVDVKARFGLDNIKLCDSGYVHFSDSSTSSEAIKSWQWNFGNGSTSNEQHPFFHYNKPGSFSAQLIATTISGCKDTATINKNIDVYKSPEIKIVGDLESCVPGRLLFKGNAISGNPDSLKWAWNFGNGQTSQLQHPAEQTYDKDGAYQLTAAVSDEHDCKATVTEVVTIHPLPAVDAGPDVVLCRDDSIQLNASGAASYGWSTDNSLSCFNCSSPKVSPVATSVYHVTGYSPFGCFYSDSVKVSVRQRFEIKSSPDDSLCIGNSVLLSASGADKYTWYPATGLDNPNIYNPKAKPNTSTLYTVVGMDHDNCFTDTAFVFVKVHPYPTIDAGPDITIPIGSNATIKPTYSPDVINWYWSPNYNIGCEQCDTVNVSPRRTTKYSVTVQNSGGCASSDHVMVYLTCPRSNVFIPNTFSPNADGNNDQFFPRGTGIALVRTMRIFNRWGEMVFERMNFHANDEKLGWDGTYKGLLLSPDVYIYTCEILCENNEVLSYTGDIALIR